MAMRKPQTVEMGKGGVEFELAPDGQSVNGAKACGDSQGQLNISHNLFCSEVVPIRAVIKRKPEITAPELQKLFPHSTLMRCGLNTIAGWIKDCDPSNKDRGRPASLALAFFEQNMDFKHDTIKSYISRARNTPRTGKK